MAASPQQRQKESVLIPHGIVDYTITFEKPILGVWTNVQFLISDVLNGLAPHGFTLEGVEVNANVQKPSEHHVAFRRSSPAVAFNLWLGKLSVTADNLSWDQKEWALGVFSAGIETIMGKSGAKIAGHQITLAMHVQLKTKTLAEITEPLLSSATAGLLDGAISFSGIIFQREQSTLIVDRSLAFANSLFVRLLRTHPANTPLTQIAEQLYRDEKQFFDSLGLEGEL
jgi:hypothetical protein